MYIEGDGEGDSRGDTDCEASAPDSELESKGEVNRLSVSVGGCVQAVVAEEEMVPSKHCCRSETTATGFVIAAIGRSMSEIIETLWSQPVKASSGFVKMVGLSQL